MDLLLKDYLTKHNVNYRVHAHEPVFTVSESNANPDVHKIPGVRGKTLFLKDDRGTFYLVGMPTTKRLDIKKLRTHLAIRKLYFGSEQELAEKIHVKPGSVSILGAIFSSDVRLILDQELWQAKIVGFHPNTNVETLELEHQDLERYYHSLPNQKEIVAL